MWVPTSTHPVPPNNVTANANKQEWVKDTMLHTWEEDTCTMYGTGLLIWPCFCDKKGISEWGKVPASQALLSAFVTHMATTYTGKTISNYLNRVLAWNILHSVPWAMEMAEMDTILCAAEKLTPDNSKRKKCLPYTPDFIAQIGQQLNPEIPLDTTVFTCLTTCFYALARSGEFTTHTLSSFNPNTHITPQNLLYNQDCHSFKSQCYTYHSPKWLALKGRTYIGCHRRGSQISCQPCKTISGSTNLRELPSFCLPSQARTPTPHERKIPAEDWSSCMCSRARALARAQNSDWLNSQVSPPRSPFHIMKVKGCWASDSFQLYL